MEQTYSTTEKMQDENKLILQGETISHLSSIANWSKFFAILGFVSSGFMILLGIITSFATSFLNKISEFAPVISVVYILVGILYIIPSLMMFRFANNTDQAIRFNDSNQLALAFKNIKSAYKFMGLLTIVVFILYILIGIISGIMAFKHVI